MAPIYIASMEPVTRRQRWAFLQHIGARRERPIETDGRLRTGAGNNISLACARIPATRLLVPNRAR